MTLPTIQGSALPSRVHTFALAGLVLACGQAMAMNGSQLGGYGIKNAGMGGASIALPLDASAAANNPAGMAFVPTSVVGNVVVFKGKSNATFAGIPPASIPSNQLNDNTTKTAPEGGFNWVVNSQMTVGLTLSGAGAGANYGEPLFPSLENLKSAQKVADVIPSISWKINPDLAVGLGLIFSFQEFESQGAFNPANLASVPGHGKETAHGVGARIGLHWNATPQHSVGATLKPRTSMSKLGDYSKDILAHSEGKVDIPAEYGLGIAWKATPNITLAADFLEVQYSKVKANQDPTGPKWKDQPIWRLGASWELDPTWTLRGGLSRNQRQITSDRTLQNLLSPAINNVAYTFGASMKLDPKSDISFSMEHNPSKTLNGTGDNAGTNITSKTQVIRVGYQKQF
jgi:long-chain fatty acid transport protein